MTNPTALWLSGIAIVVTLIGIGIQWRLWFLAGPRVVVVLEDGISVYSSDRQGFVAMIVRVTNNGRAAAVIQDWDLRDVDFGDSLEPEARGIRANGPDLPVKLEPHEQRVWMVDQRDARIHLLLDDPDQVRRLRAEVRYGTKIKRSRQVAHLRTPGDWFGARRKYPWWSRLLGFLRRPHRGAVAEFAPLTLSDRGEGLLFTVRTAGKLPVRSVTVRATADRYERQMMSDDDLATLHALRFDKLVIWHDAPWTLPLDARLLALARERTISIRVEYRRFRRLSALLEQVPKVP